MKFLCGFVDPIANASHRNRSPVIGWENILSKLSEQSFVLIVSHCSFPGRRSGNPSFAMSQRNFFQVSIVQIGSSDYGNPEYHVQVEWNLIGWRRR